MTDHEIQRIGATFGSYLERYRACFRQTRIAKHFDNYCRGLLSDLPRKSVEPIALACGTAVRTLQEFLATAHWDHELARQRLHRHLAEVLDDLPEDSLGTIGVVDETSCLKKGDQTPGVKRQYLGCVGKIDNGLVTVHVGVARGQFQALLDADVYLPRSWDEDRDRCRAAGIPDEVRYRSKWRIALDQLMRLDAHGLAFDWLVFDEGYGSKVPFLTVLSVVNQHFVGEVSVNFSVADSADGTPQRADRVLTPAAAKRGRRFRLRRQTVGDTVWRATSRAVTVAGRSYTLIVAINESTAEVKYFLTNATAEPLSRVLAVAFRRATIEHSFRVAKSEAGLTHYEGRQWVGLVRHLMLTLVVLGFVAVETKRLRGKKSAGDAGAGVPGVERPLRDAVPASASGARSAACRRRGPLSPASQRSRHCLPQETTT